MNCHSASSRGPQECLDSGSRTEIELTEEGQFSRIVPKLINVIPR